MKEGSVIRGRAALPPPKASRVHPRDRVCASPGCETRLSIYNGNVYCWAHQPRRPVSLQDPRRGREAA